MRPETFGRALGIGARLLGQRMLPPAPPPPSAEALRARAERSAQKGMALGKQARGVGQGSRNFGRAVWNPFAQASRALWFEITGAFFALFAVLFAQHLWTIRVAWRSGPEHSHFLVYVALSAMFAWFAVSSFARSRRRSR